MAEDLLLELGRFLGCGVDSAGEAAQDEPCRELVGGCVRAAEAAAALEQPGGREHPQLFAEPVGGGDDHAAKLSKCSAAYVDGASACDQQQPQRLASLPVARKGERLVGKCRPCRADRVERVVFAAQAALRSWCAADLEHPLATAGEVTREPGAVTARALDRPGTPAVRGLAHEAQRRLVATRICRDRLPGQHRSRGCSNDRQDVLVQVSIDTDHVVQFICKHPIDPPSSVRRVRSCRSECGKPRRQDGNESRRHGGQAPDQASSGRQTGAAAHTQTNHSQGTHQAASHPMSHTRHDDNQAGDGPRQTDPPSLTVP